MDGASARAYSSQMPRTFAARENWCDVSALEFEIFLRSYPRPLEARPALHRKARYRESDEVKTFYRVNRYPGAR